MSSYGPGYNSDILLMCTQNNVAYMSKTSAFLWKIPPPFPPFIHNTMKVWVWQLRGAGGCPMWSFQLLLKHSLPLLCLIPLFLAGLWICAFIYIYNCLISMWPIRTHTHTNTHTNCNIWRSMAHSIGNQSIKIHFIGNGIKLEKSQNSLYTSTTESY